MESLYTLGLRCFGLAGRGILMTAGQTKIQGGSFGDVAKAAGRQVMRTSKNDALQKTGAVLDAKDAAKNTVGAFKTVFGKNPNKQ